MEKYNIEKIEKEMEELNERYKVACNLVKCGIPRSMTKFWTAPMPESGYSMGECIRITCNGTNIQTIDKTQEYARSCTWKAKHGYVLINFNKKELRELLEIMAIYEEVCLNKTKDLQDGADVYGRMRDFVLAHIDKEKSELKKMPISI